MGNIISEFRRSLNLFDATSIVAGTMIGSGIFIVSADIARTLGSPGWLLVVWIITGILTLIAALSYGELASMMPQAGGQYVYLREAYNPLSGFLFGWTLFMVIQTGSIAAVGMAFAKFMGVIFPWFSEQRIWLDLGFIKISTVHALAISSIILLSWVNAQGIKFGKFVQNSFTITKILALIGLVVVGFFFAKSTGAIELNSKIFWDAVQVKDGVSIPLSGFALVAALGTAMVGALFAADAWNNVTFTAGETLNPKKNIPLSLFLGSFIVLTLYVLANYVYMQALPLRGNPDGTTVFERGMQFATDDRLGTAAIYGLFGSYAAIIMAILVVISTFGCNNGMILSGARVYYAMANDNLFFKRVGTLNAKGVPSNGLLYQAIWASLLCLSGTYNDLLDYVIFAVLIFYALTILGVFILRKKQPDAERPYKAFGYPVIPAIYIIAATFIMIILLVYKPNYTWPGLVIVILGIPVYYLWRKHDENKD
ncbi:MAG TPA: amino acid transporter [Bacteroidales bacterium]|nr:amino acid transporter [Bacteroidales bacterium]